MASVLHVRTDHHQASLQLGSILGDPQNIAVAYANAEECASLSKTTLPLSVMNDVAGAVSEPKEAQDAC